MCKRYPLRLPTDLGIRIEKTISKSRRADVSNRLINSTSLLTALDRETLMGYDRTPRELVHRTLVRMGYTRIGMFGFPGRRGAALTFFTKEPEYFGITDGGPSDTPHSRSVVLGIIMGCPVARKYVFGNQLRVTRVKRRN